MSQASQVGSTVTATDDTFAQLVLARQRPVVVDFWAEWCPSCRSLARTLEELAAELAGQLVIAKINADENPRTTRAYQVLSLPTLLLFRGGVVVHSIVGARPKSVLRRAWASADGAYVNHG